MGIVAESADAGEIERLGGSVKDLAGDGVLAFFGTPWWEYGKSWASFADLVVGERPS